MILKNAKIILEDKIIQLGWIEIIDKKIVKISEGQIDKEGINLKGNIIMPGFIDCHVHGGYNYSLKDMSNESYTEFAKQISKEGITKYCQATVTENIDDISKILEFYSNWMKNENHKEGKAKQIGLHLEGPFISSKRKGAHSEKLLLKPNIKLMEEWIKKSNSSIKIVTYAIEEDNNGNFTKFLIKNNIIPSIGHSDCTAYEFENLGLKNGAKHITHLYNAMSQISHYTKGNGIPAGLVSAALYNNDVLCELITDGIHLNDDTIKLTYKIKGASGICLVTDAMSAKGLKDGNYKLGPLDVYKKGMAVKLVSNNAIAGSAATFDHCFRYFKNLTNVDYLTMAKISSENIAKQLNIFNETGSIKKNKFADLVVLNSKNNVLMTIVEGKITYKVNNL